MRSKKIVSVTRTAATTFATVAVLAAPALNVACLLTTPAHAATAPAAAPGVSVDVTEAGFTAPAAVRAGGVAFRISATDPEGAYIGLVRLKPGVSLDRYLADLEKAYDDADPEGAQRASKALQREVVMYGGGAVQPGTPVTYGVRLTPGNYHLVDFKDVGRPGLAGKVKALRVVPAGRPAPEPRGEATVVQTETAEGTRFRAPAEVRAGAPLRVVNRSRQFNEAILMPVRPGTTNEQVGAFYRGMEGGPRADYPFVGGPVGMVPLSPGRSATVAAPLRPGTYALVTWMHSHHTGRLFGATGMHEIVTVR